MKEMALHEVVISGVAGSIPESSTIGEFESKIFSDESFITAETSPKWLQYEHKVPLFTGKMKDRLYFDNLFFGVHYKLTSVMDLHARHALEKTFEALCDAGLNPEEISGSNAAVIFTSMASETEFQNVSMGRLAGGYAMLGHSRCMQSNRVSYFFNLIGPSYLVNSSWNGAMEGLRMASSLVASGRVKFAIVGASNILHYPGLSLQYTKLGLLNQDGKTKCFSADADGYTRSSGVIVFVVQRASDSYKNYGSIVKCCADTEMQHHYPLPDVAGFEQFLSNFYSDININYSDFGYIEADGSASLRTDAMELNGYAKVICPGRKEALPVGSVKSRVGHTESTSAFMSIINALIAFKTGYIPPTINFTSPNPLVPALVDGRMKVVTEKTPLNGDLIGVTCFGIGSCIGHVLLKKNPNSCPAKEASYFPPDGIPRLFVLSGRDDVAMNQILEKVIEKPVDDNFYALNHTLHKKCIPNHLYRGSSIVGPKSSKVTQVIPFSSGGAGRQVWYIFSGMGSQWTTMGSNLMIIPVIRNAIEKCHNILLPKGINLIEILTTEDSNIFDNILHSFIGIAAIQIALVDLLELLGVKADGIVGHSVGELGCSYADKCLTAEQVILAAYSRGRASLEANLIKGMMAAVGKGYNQIKDELPEGIEVACHNSKTSCTLSGPADTMQTYVEELKSKGVFAKLVNVSNIAYHSKNIAPAAPLLLKYLKEIIPEPKLRSSKWISSSVPEKQWESDQAKFCSAEYHTNNLLSYVLFEEATAHIPKDAVCVEIAPYGLLQAIVKKSLPNCSHIPLNKKNGPDCSFLIEAIGSLFNNGVQIELSKLYSPMKYPLARETDFNSTVTWSHAEPMWPLLSKHEVNDMNPKQSFMKTITLLADQQLDLKSNHIIAGNSYFLKTQALMLIMDVLRTYVEVDTITIKCFFFQNINFHQYIHLEDNIENSPTVEMTYQVGTGAFEIGCEEVKITSGYLTHLLAMPKANLDSDYVQSQVKKVVITGSQIYDYFESYDCVYDGPLRNIAGITIFEKGFSATILWRGNTQLYLEAIFKLMEFYSSFLKDKYVELESIFQFYFDPTALSEDDEDVEVIYDESLGYLVAKGVRLLFFSVKPAQFAMNDSVSMNNFQFTPYSKLQPSYNFAEICLQIFRENSSAPRLVLDLIVEKNSPLCDYIVDFINKSKFYDNFEVLLRPRDSIFSISMENNPNICYLVVAENDAEEKLAMFIKKKIPFYFIHVGRQTELSKSSVYGDLTPIVEQNLESRKIVLYKKKKPSFEDCVFVKMPGENLIKEAETMQNVGPNKKYFLVLKYRILSDLIDIPKSSFYCHDNNKRLIFLDDSSPPFDPIDSFYKNQLAKDLKVNIAYKGTWGSLRNQAVDERSQSTVSLDYIADPTLSDIKCTSVDLKSIAINLQSIMFPKKYNKISVIEYSGVLHGEEVFGIGKLTSDNFLEVDPHLCWKIPSGWSFKDATTVPFYYTMAYHILYLRGKCTNRPVEAVLIHGGHTPFAHAVISLALTMGVHIFTTCFTKEQKHFILRKFPQLKEGNVFVIAGEEHKTFITSIMDTTNGRGARLVIDSLEDHELRNITLHCTGEYGSYFYMSNNDMVADHTFGMSIFLSQTAMFGYNPELIFDLKEEEKLILCSLLNTGIKMHIVKPLDGHCVPINVTRQQASEIVVSESQNMFPRKTIMNINKIEPNSQLSTAVSKKKNYMIVGSYNCLWFDILSWLVSNGADSIHVVLNHDEISPYTKTRYDNFMKKYKYINVEFSGTETLNSSQTCNNLVKSVEAKNDIDILFYLKPGFERQMTNIDFALRLHSKTSCFVSIGFQACRIVEKRCGDGFRGVSFILTKSSPRSWMVINALDNWSKKCNKHDNFISVEKSKRRVLERAMKDRITDMLPSTCHDLVALGRNISEKPCFVEMATRSVNNTYARGLNPVFMFPGLKLAQLEKFSAQLFYPVYMAQYPLVIKSLTEVAQPLTEILLDKFNLGMYTLIAEGWAGPLVLTVAKMLEKQGKICEIILLEGAPQAILQWNSRLKYSDSIISKYMPSINVGEKITIEDIRHWSTDIAHVIAQEEGEGVTEEQVYNGFRTLVNRLDVLQTYSRDNLTLESVIHLFTTKEINTDLLDLKKICKSELYLEAVEASNSYFLDNVQIATTVNNLALLEYKMCANAPHIKDVATNRILLNTYRLD